MALIKCGECGHSISDKASQCPNCGNPIRREIKIKVPTFFQSVNKYILFLIIVGIAVLAFICFLLTRCIIPNCFKGKYKGNDYCAEHMLLYDNSAYDITSTFDDNENKKNAYADLTLNVTGLYDHQYCEGTISNQGRDTYYFVKVKASFKDSMGNVIETGDSYAVGNEGLAPGEKTSFYIYGNENRDIEDCSVEIYSYQ